MSYIKQIATRTMLLGCMCLMSASVALAQITLSMHNRTAREVIREIEKNSNYRFFYNDDLAGLNTRINVDADNRPIEEVMDMIARQSSFAYVIKENNQVVLSTATAVAQQTEKRITGVVNDEFGEPVIGANVFVQGTTNGTVTGIDGDFSLNVSEGQTIVVSFLGYTERTFTVGTQNHYNISLVEDTQALDEVVVTALGIRRSQKALSYNVQELKGEALTGVKDVNFVNSLSGKVAGVTINTSSAGVGGATRVVMRGTKSITKDNNALYVIDGVPILNSNRGGLNQNDEFANQPRGEGIADLNPEDIESMSVLTGAAAAALYGSNAANGAIVITTKKGSVGKPRVSISNQTTFSDPFVMPKFQNTYGNRGAGSPNAEYKSWGDKQSTYNYNPSDFFNTGTTVQTNASLSVGSEKNQTYMSIGVANANGILPENDYGKYNATFRNTTKFLDDKMTLDFGFSYIKQKDKNMIAQGRYYNPLTAVYTFPRGENFDTVKEYEVYNEANGYNTQQWTWGDGGLNMQNPYWILNRNAMTNKRDRYMMNASLQYDILDWLNVMGRVRLDNSQNNNEQKNYASTNELFAGVNGRYKSMIESDKQIYADLLLNINKSFEDYSVSANIGTSISDQRSNSQGIDGQNLLIPNFFAITNIDKNAPKTRLEQSGWHEQTQSIFANVELGWRSMLYLTLTGRNDWASALANTQNSSFFYPSVGLSGVISEMAEMPEFISYLKVRGSYSSVGSPIPRNLSIPTYEFDGQSGTWKTNTYKPLDDLKPERTGSWEAGLSAKFWGNRLGLELTWYKSNTKNQTLEIPISASSGYTSMYVQTGNVQNHGVEIALSADNQFGDFNWYSSFTASYNKNEIKQLVEEGEFFDPSGAPITLDMISQGGIGSVEYRLTKGGTMGDLWTKTKLKTNDDGSVFLNEEGKPVLDNELQKAGSVLPKWNMGFRNDFSYKGVNLGFLISARLGGIVASPTQSELDGFGVSKATADARDNGGVMIGSTLIDAEKYYSTVGQANGLMSDYIYKATNVRLQEVSIGYTLPSKWFNDVARVNVAFVGRNLWMIYNKAPFDPESIASTGTYFQGIDYFMQPSLRNLGFTVKVDF